MIVTDQACHDDDDCDDVAYIDTTFYKQDTQTQIQVKMHWSRCDTLSPAMPNKIFLVKKCFMGENHDLFLPKEVCIVYSNPTAVWFILLVMHNKKKHDFWTFLTDFTCTRTQYSSLFVFYLLFLFSHRTFKKRMMMWCTQMSTCDVDQLP